MTLIHADCLQALENYPSETFHSVVTDPPYGLKFMGKNWDHGIPGIPYWEAILDACLPGAHLLAFGGTRTHHRLMCVIEDAGWEIRDVIMWVYGSGFPKSMDVSKAIDKAAGVERDVVAPPPYTRGRSSQSYSDTRRVSYDYPPHPITAPATDAAKTWQGYGTAIKPAYEPIILARKPLVGAVVKNVLEHGTGALNIDASRIPLNGDYKCGANGRPSQTGLGDNYDSASANKHSDVGRFPANLIHDGSEEVVSLFPNTKSGKPGIMRKGENTGAAYGAESRPSGTPMTGFGDDGSAARFFYCAKASKKERQGSKHPTVKPLALMRYLVRLVTPQCGIVLDPFMGSGTTCEAAALEGFDYVGIDQNSEYVDDARRRIERLPRKQPTLFAPIRHIV